MAGVIHERRGLCYLEKERENGAREGAARPWRPTAPSRRPPGGPGAPVSERGPPALQISRHLGRIYSEMIFVNGFVHCDPHPGNVLVRKHPDTGKAEVVLLDHGLYQVRRGPVPVRLPSGLQTRGALGHRKPGRSRGFLHRGCAPKSWLPSGASVAWEAAPLGQ